MSLARLVITAVVVEGRSKSAVAREYRHSRFWVHQLVNRFVAAGETAFEPRSRRPHSSPHAVGLEVEDQIAAPQDLDQTGWMPAPRPLPAHLQSAGWSRCRRSRRSGVSCLGAGS
jgi:hypothetical protein